MRTRINLDPLKAKIKEKEGTILGMCTRHQLDYYRIRNALSGKRPLAESILILCDILEVDPYAIWEHRN